MADKKLTKTVNDRSAVAPASPKTKAAAKAAVAPAVKRSAKPEPETGPAKTGAAKAKIASKAKAEPKAEVAAKPSVQPTKPAVAAKGNAVPAAKSPAKPVVKAVTKPVGKPTTAERPAQPTLVKAAPAAKPASSAKHTPDVRPPIATKTPAKAVAAGSGAPVKPATATVAATKVAADKTAAATIAPVPVAPAAAAPTSAPAPVAPAPVAAAPVRVAPFASSPIKRPVVAGKAPAFKTNEHIVYPAHGVGQITAVEEQVVAGYKLELFVISFVKDKMILKVPLPKVASVGMRKLAEPPVVKRALDTLTGRARIKRTMWSRRAQEYEAKINSGDLVAIAEVVRDLYRSDAQPEQSYSERQLYEAALDRIARELAVVEKLTDSEALKLIDGQLQKGPRRGKADDVEAAGDEAEDEQAGIVEAA